MADLKKQKKAKQPAAMEDAAEVSELSVSSAGKDSKKRKAAALEGGAEQTADDTVQNKKARKAAKKLADDAASSEHSKPQKAGKGKQGSAEEQGDDDSVADAKSDANEIELALPKRAKKPTGAGAINIKIDNRTKSSAAVPAKPPATAQAPSASADDTSDEASELSLPKKAKKPTGAGAIKIKVDDRTKATAKPAKPTKHASPATSSGAGSSAAAAAVAETDETRTRVFVGNLSFKVTDEAMYEFFGQCGDINSLHYVTDKTSGKFYGSAFVDYTTPEAAVQSLALSGSDFLGRPVKVRMLQPCLHCCCVQKRVFGRLAGRQGRTRLAKRATTAKCPSTAQCVRRRCARNRLDATPSFWCVANRACACTCSVHVSDELAVIKGNLPFDIEDQHVHDLFASCGEIKAIRWVEKDGQFKGAELNSQRMHMRMRLIIGLSRHARRSRICRVRG